MTRASGATAPSGGTGRAAPPSAADPRAHRASVAWAALRPESPSPRGVQKLQEKAKGSVYRLEGVGPAGRAVIAKHGSIARIRQERAMYERVLPALDVAIPRYHGAVELAEHGWIFVEDAGGVAYAPADASHRALAGGWLARLHLAGALAPTAAGPADRGAAYHLAQLRDGRALLEAHLDHPALTADDVAVARSVVRRCERLASRWHDVEALCASLPATIVHGDFAPKNMRVRESGEGPELVVFDWGSAGRAPAAADLVQWSGRTASQWGYWANPDLAVYAGMVREGWPALDRATLEQAAMVGKLFRCLVCVALSAQSYATPWVDRAARNMRIYDAEMADALEAAGWMAGGAR